MGKVNYSFVIPVYNEEESLKELFSEVLSVAAGLNTYECIFVDDASSDATPDVLKEFKNNINGHVKVVTLPRRSGQTFALKEGIGRADGNYVITLDGDLQNDPADVPALIKRMEEGFDCVCGWRRSRRDSPIKTGLSKFANVLQRCFSSLRIHDVSCTLRLYTKEAAKRIPLNWEGQHRFIPLSLSLQGFKVGEIKANHRSRKFGASKYSHRRIFKVMKDFFKVIGSKGK